MDEVKTIHLSFNQDFCKTLEFHISKTMEIYSKENKETPISGFWCDGIVCPEIGNPQLTKKYINNLHTLNTEAYFGKDGQTRYQLIVHFGKYSNRRVQRETKLDDCLPSIENSDWIVIDTENKIFEITLL